MIAGVMTARTTLYSAMVWPCSFRSRIVVTPSPVEGGRFGGLCASRAGTPESGPTALVFRTGCTYRQRLEQVFTEFGWPSSARFELGTLAAFATFGVGFVAAGILMVRGARRPGRVD